MKKLTILSIALLMLGGVLFAQHPMMKDCNPGMHPQMGKGMNMGKGMECMDEMKLTDAQKKKLDEIRTGFRKTENTLAAEIENLKIDVHTAMKAENFAKAKELNKLISTKENLLADARIDMMAASAKELTAEQKEIFKRNMMQFRGQKHNMQGMKGGFGMQKHMGNCGDCDDNCGKEGYNDFTRPKTDPPTKQNNTKIK